MISTTIIIIWDSSEKKDFWFIYVSPGALEAVYIYVLEEKWTINSEGGIQIRHSVGLSRGED